MYNAISVTADLVRGNRIILKLRRNRHRAGARRVRFDLRFYFYCQSMGGINS